jgi:hypothetical protein
VCAAPDIKTDAASYSGKDGAVALNAYPLERKLL